MLLVTVGLLVSLAGTGLCGSVLPEVWSDLASEYLEKEGWDPGCKDCARIRQILERRSPMLNLTELRLELAKQTLLRKLGLGQPPTPGLAASSLPAPIARGSLLNKHSHSPSPKKPHSQRVFAFVSDLSCAVDKTRVSLKLKLQLPEQARRREDLNSAKLWLHSSMAGISTGHAHISSKPCGSANLARMKNMPASLQPKDDWLEMDVTWLLLDVEECYSIQIAWSADLTSLECSTYLNTTMKPFILVDVLASEDVEDGLRDKREVNCAAGVSDCCREKLHVSFADIGWDNWILQPKGYDAYYCKGNCANLGALSLGATPYHSVIKKLSMKNSHMLDFSPCCTPTTLSAVQLIYVKNDSVIEKTIPNLTVESCGCM